MCAGVFRVIQTRGAACRNTYEREHVWGQRHTSVPFLRQPGRQRRAGPGLPGAPALVSVMAFNEGDQGSLQEWPVLGPGWKRYDLVAPGGEGQTSKPMLVDVCQRDPEDKLRSALWPELG